NMTDVNTVKEFKVSLNVFNEVSEQLSDFKKFNKEEKFKDSGVDIEGLDEFDENKVIATLNKASENSLSKEYSKSYMSDLGELTNASENIDSIDKSSTRYKASKKALDDINIENAKDAMATVKVLSEKKIITDDEASSFIKSMNESIKQKGTKSYREQKKAKLLNIKSLTEKYKVSGSNIDKFISEHVNGDDIKKTTSSSKILSAKSRLYELERYDLDSTSKNLSNKLNSYISGTEEFSNVDSDIMLSSKKKVFDKTMNEIKRLDSETLKEFQNIYSENASNLNFQKEVLGWDLDRIDDLILNNETDDAMSAINASKIAHGKYAGYSFGHLDANQVKEMLENSYSESSIGNIDDSVFEKSRSIIERMQKLEKGGTIRSVTPPSSFDDFTSTKTGSDFIGSLRKEMNETIKTKGKNAGSKFNKNAGKSIIDQISDSWKGMSSKGKMITGAIAGAAALGITAFAYSGNGSIKDKDGEYVKKNDDSYKEQYNNSSNVSNSGYSKVPSSDTSYYQNQNNGVNINIRGKAPRNSSPVDAGKSIGKALGNNVNINSSYSDSRKQIQDRDVDNIMSNATY
ncbi:MAG: hypothetical protein RR192_01680, partial [Peptostreptococcaceae bacterium]